MVAAYNSNSVKARNLMTNVRRDDILVQQMPCVARVQVGKAFFMPGYSSGGGGVPAPFMRMTGTVASVFIEEDDDRTFPCNDKEIQMMDSEQVMIDYMLSPEEISSLALKGMFHDESFRPPANLEGNTIEIPVNIVYRGVYETPVCFVEIVGPLELATSTKDNNYYGLFEACEPSPVVQQIKEDQYEYTQFNEPAPEPEPTFEDFPAEPTPEEEREARMRQVGIIGLEDPEKVAQREDDDIFGKVDQEIAQAAAQAARVRESVDRAKIAAEILHPARDDFRQQKAEQDASADNSFKLYGFAAGEPEKPSVARPDPETRASNIYNQLRTRAEALRQQEQVQQGGDGGDGEAGAAARPEAEAWFQDPDAEGFEPFGGFAIEGGDESKATTPEARAKAEAAKQQRINRQVDRGEDLKAMNMGITDTAGFGASTEPQAASDPSPVASNAKAIAARNMLQRLKERQTQAAQQVQQIDRPGPSQEQESGQQYL